MAVHRQSRPPHDLAVGLICAVRVSVPDRHHVVRDTADQGVGLGGEHHVHCMAGLVLDERRAHRVYHCGRDRVDAVAHADGCAGPQLLLFCEPHWRDSAAVFHESDCMECKGKDGELTSRPGFSEEIPLIWFDRLSFGAVCTL